MGNFLRRDPMDEAPPLGLLELLGELLELFPCPAQVRLLGVTQPRHVGLQEGDFLGVYRDVRVQFETESFNLTEFVSSLFLQLMDFKSGKKEES